MLTKEPTAAAESADVTAINQLAHAYAQSISRGDNSTRRRATVPSPRLDKSASRSSK
jgi:hypothetical protein